MAKESAAPIAFGDPILSLGFESALTNDGGTFALDTTNQFPRAYEGQWIEFPSTSGGAIQPLRDIISGTVDAIPLPPAVWLFGSGLLGLVGIARRKKGA